MADPTERERARVELPYTLAIEPLDLEKENPVAGPPGGGLEEGDRAKRLDGTREKVTMFLLWLLAGVCLGVFIVLAFHKRIDLEPATAKDIATLIFTPVVTLVGTTLGFYFGGKEK